MVIKQRMAAITKNAAAGSGTSALPFVIALAPLPLV
jgi:hypothetical protein